MNKIEEINIEICNSYKYKINGLLFYYNEIVMPSLVEKAEKEYKGSEVVGNKLSLVELQLITVNVLDKLLNTPDALKILFPLEKRDWNNKKECFEAIVQDNFHWAFDVFDGGD